MAELYVVFLKSLEGKTEIHLQFEANTEQEARGIVEDWMLEGEEIEKIESLEIDYVRFAQLKLLCQIADNINVMNFGTKGESPEEKLLYDILNQDKTVNSLLITSVLPTLIADCLKK